MVNPLNLIRSKPGRRVSFKCEGKWVRDEQSWLSDQERGDPIEELHIVAEGHCLTGLKNRRTGQWFLTGLRKATIEDEVRATKNFHDRKSKIILPNEIF